ncbi:outer membrane lipoprotein carrier/sorting protein LolA [Geotalea daltonii FRC-32]|uniref:Outer membrane lipoprotein carrier/sorting protein LolA n=1 Tax=Geotalea daltonii (strain DSM 22248 / JCM 15807 / FRC-32) TaxID=316067 RepID=B9M1Y8_GEODF|nr:outer membrane lipoprotein carrier protein LolA [Geotalea daltonii]ACM19284.1 outer membrane lipoprotein carrier/sorting protein LolA [Geotalea daltonii FRC-32]
MRSCFSILLLSCVVLLQSALPQHGLAAEMNDVVKTLEQGYRTLNDLQADFSQQTEIASMKRKERGAGELFLKKGANGQAMFSFNYSKPRQQIISNGKKVWYYLPENRQVMVSDVASLFEGGNSVALNYLSGMGHVSRDFNIRFAGDGRDKKGNYLLELIPKKPSQAMAKLHLGIKAQAVASFTREGQAADPFPIAYSVVFDSFGNRTVIEFSNIKVNRGMRSDRFNFKVPSGVEVINPGQTK